jgi:hypothetical protein
VAFFICMLGCFVIFQADLVSGYIYAP